MRHHTPASLTRTALAFGAALGALSAAAPAKAQENGHAEVTFNRDA